MRTDRSTVSDTADTPEMASSVVVICVNIACCSSGAASSISRDTSTSARPSVTSTGDATSVTFDGNAVTACGR